VIGNAVTIMRVAIGEESEEVPDEGKRPAAVEVGTKGGKARATALSVKRRKQIARKAAEFR